ncbi:MAG: cyclase family protein [Lentisphaeria bacterium]|nr:cyclase family protein [Lentisphaeria bacterium]NQZ69667.1 cyclase family protein [Lentisphaeria bacterium]
MSKWIDITRPLGDNVLCWPGRQAPEHSWEKSIADGHHCNVSKWSMNAHSGTHIDAPLHFIDGGTSIDQISPDILAGPCRVIDLEEMGCEQLDQTQAEELRGVERLLIRTRHSAASDEYPDHTALMSPAAAQLLVDSGLVMIGTDRLSVDDSPPTGYELHQIFLGTSCIIVEGLNLTDIVPGSYEIFASPLRLEDAEASPARVFLSESNA